MSTLSEQADAAYKQTILAASQNSEKSNAGVVDMDLPTPATQPVPAEPEDPNVTTEDDLISAIKRWVKSGHDDGASGAVTIRDSAQSIVDGLHEVLKEYPPRQPISDVRLKELVALHAPEIGRKPEPKIPTASNQKPATSKLTDLEWEHPDWRVAFKSVNQLQSGGIRMLIKHFLPEGTNLITGYAGDGKSWLGLSITKALTTGQPLFGIPDFEVVGITPVLYLTPEQNGAAFRQRCETLQITNDERLFLCRTCSEGSKLPLVDSKLEAAIRYLRPVVILDTVIRFTESDDENSATQNQKLVDDIIHLRNVGARTVIGVHHSRKDLKEGEPTLEAAVRGSGDLAAMTDGVWAVIRNDRLYKNGAGPNQISVIPVKTRDFTSRPFKLALTHVGPTNTIGFGGPGLISCLDESHDLVPVDEAEIRATALEQLEELIQTAPGITLAQLKEATGLAIKQIDAILAEAGWSKPKGREHIWNKEEQS